MRINLTQNTPEWENYRRMRVMASDVPIICGKSPYKKPHQLWEEKALGKKGFYSKAMQRGHDMEVLALEWARNEYQMDFQPAVFEGPVSWRGCSLDGYDETEHRAIEIKHPNEETCRNIWMNNKIPEHYIYQMQAQIEIMSLPWIDLVIPEPDYLTLMKEGKEFAYESFEVKRNDEIIRSYQDDLRLFYQSLLDFNPVKAEMITREDEEWSEEAQAWLDAHATLNAAKEYEAMCRDALKYRMGNESCCVGAGVKVTKYPIKGSVDYSKIPELKSVDIEKYRKPSSEGWRFIALDAPNEGL